MPASVHELLSQCMRTAVGFKRIMSVIMLTTLNLTWVFKGCSSMQ